MERDFRRRRGDWPFDHHPRDFRDPVYGPRPRIEKHIYLYREQLLFDVTSQVSVVARVRRNGDGSADDSLIQAVDSNTGMLNRWIDKYINLAKGRMSAFILEPYRRTKSDVLKTDDEIDIELQMPWSWDDTLFQPLTQAVHDYVVNGVMYELFSLLLPPKEHVVNVKQIDMEQSYDDIKRCVCAVKPGILRKPMQPF